MFGVLFLCTVVYLADVCVQITGQWTWNNATNTLEYLGTNPVGERERQGAKKKDKRDNKAEVRSAAGPRTTSRGTSRQPIKVTAEHTQVTLQDVKTVARYMMLEVEEIPASFDDLYEKEQFDRLLYFMINYFHWFFAKRAKETYTNPVHIEPSLAEKQLYEKLCIEVEIARMMFGRVYGALILGTDVCDVHHMACGNTSVSDTYRDRSIYEALYSYCTFVIWIVFKRKEHDVILNEVNRLLRTDTFNPAARPKPVLDVNNEEKQLTPAQYRRSLLARPSLKLLVNQRSEAVISIFPHPWEEAYWLFERYSTKDELRKNVVKQANEQCPRQNVDISKLQLGIIGEPLSLFDPVTLLSLETDEHTHADKANEEGVDSSVMVSNAAILGQSTAEPTTGQVSSQHLPANDVTADSAPTDHAPANDE